MLNDPTEQITHDITQDNGGKPSGRKRHTGTQRLILAVNLFLVLVCLAGAIGLVYGKSQLDQRLQTEKVEVSTSLVTVTTAVQDTGSTTPADTTPAAATFPPANPEAQNFLIAGSDTNPCVDPSSPWSGAADPARDSIGQRSDTIMVVRVDPTTRAAAILSFPRDLWVHIPGKGNNRINAAYVKDDYSLLAQTIFENFNITIDHYIQVDFCAFKRIVDAVGGVAVPFENPIRDNHVGLDVQPAAGETLPFCHTFSGDEALAYVRSRHLKWVDSKGVAHEDPASDFGRISRQQDFLRRVLQVALDKGLLDPAVARSILDSLQNDIVTESGFTLDDMLMFAGVMHDVAPDTINTYQVESKSATISGRAVREPALKGENMKAILAIFQGTATLFGAPEQVMASDTTAVGAGSGATGTTVAAGPMPEENGKGEIIPPKDVHC